MIQTDTQLEVNERWSSKFKEELAKLTNIFQREGDSISSKLIRESLTSLIEELEIEALDYKNRKRGYKSYLHQLVAIQDSLLPDRLKVAFADHPNKTLKNWRVITEEEFAQSKFFAYTPQYIDYGYFTKDYEGNVLEKPISCHYYIFHDGTGFALENDYWGKKVHYYAFGCEHKYKELSSEEAQIEGYRGGHCIHVYKCEICGHISVQDSSD